MGDQENVLTFDSIVKTPKCDHLLESFKAVGQYFAVVLFGFQFYPVCNLKNLSILEKSLSVEQMDMYVGKVVAGNLL